MSKINNKPMKNIIQRNLPLDKKYILVDRKYIPITEGCGLCCDNCGHLIANIATVKDEDGKQYSIGFDCMETFLMNNQLLDKKGVEEYQRIKPMIPKILRFSKCLLEVIQINDIKITGILFERPDMFQSYITFYWLTNNKKDSRDNDSVKLKDVDFDFLIETLKNFFPNLEILVK